MLKFHRVDETNILENDEGWQLEIVYTTSFGDQRNCFFQFPSNQEEEAYLTAAQAMYGELSVELVEI